MKEMDRILTKTRAEDVNIARRTGFYITLVKLKIAMRTQNEQQ